VIERRLLGIPRPSLEAGTIRLIRGNYEGRVRDGSWRGVTGLRIREDESATVSEVWAKSPAAAAGVRSGDAVLSVDGKPLRGLPVGGMEWLLRGHPGSTALVMLQTPGQPPRSLTLARIPD
jgi:C-terminal processing protease CtpA/Prc